VPGKWINQQYTQCLACAGIHHTDAINNGQHTYSYQELLRINLINTQNVNNSHELLWEQHRFYGKFMWLLAGKYSLKACCHCDKATVLCKNHMEHTKWRHHAWTTINCCPTEAVNQIWQNSKLHFGCKNSKNVQIADIVPNSKITDFMESCIWLISWKMSVMKSLIILVPQITGITDCQ